VLGQKVDAYDFQVPSEFTAQMVEGFVVWPDGSPAQHVEVLLLCPANPEPDGYVLDYAPPHAVTDEQGRFRLSGFKGMSYWLEARGSKRTPKQVKAVAMHSAARKLILKNDLQNLKVVLSEEGSFGGCGDSVKRTR
jgi:hypothetical protein